VSARSKPAGAGRATSAPWRLLPALLAFSVVIALLLLAFLALFVGSEGLIVPEDVLAAASRPDTLAQMLIETSRLPRLVAALSVGSALGLAGAVMQTLLRNPLAAPDILGVSSGALLGLAVNSLILNGIFPPILATVLGGAAGGGLSLLLGGGPSAGPVRLALAGVAVSLFISGLSTLLILLADQRASGLILWSAGMMDQTGWTQLGVMLPLIGLALGVMLVCARALDLHGLGADLARGLGLSVLPALLAGVAALVCVGGSVVIAGPIGFVGLAVPNLLRHLGLRRHLFLLPASALLGATLVLGADVVAQAFGRNGASLPTGTVLGLLAAPIVILTLSRSRELRPEPRPAAIAARTQPARQLWLWFAPGLALAILAGLVFGDGTLGLAEITTDGFGVRGPRVFIALAAGAMLGVAGLLVQAQLRNPLAAPETLGLQQAAGLASVIALLAGARPGGAAMLMAGLAGTTAAWIAVTLLAGKNAGARLPLIGIALSASLAALTLLIVIRMDLRAANALHWISGTLHGRSWDDLARFAPWLGLVLVAAWLLVPALDVLQFGDRLMADLGGHPGRIHLISGVVVICSIAATTATIGAIAFLGLLAPNAARMLVGTRHRLSVWLSAAVGAITLCIADTIGRATVPPFDLPAGVITTLIGAPAFLVLLTGRRT
jgi:ABC-type Fe3+-siderophore transport system permease subunit